MLLRVCEMMMKAERLTLCKWWGRWWKVLSTEDLELHSTVHWLEAQGQLKLSMTHLQKHTGRHKIIHNRVRCYVACVCVMADYLLRLIHWFIVETQNNFWPSNKHTQPLFMKKLLLDQIALTFILEHNSVKHLIIEKIFFSKKQFSLLSVWFQSHAHTSKTRWTIRFQMFKTVGKISK